MAKWFYSTGAARTVEYRYDDIYRLTKEIITTSSGWERTISYTYDAVGNRKTMRKENAAERIDVTYAYAERDQCGSVKVDRQTKETRMTTMLEAAIMPAGPGMMGALSPQ